MGAGSPFSVVPEPDTHEVCCTHLASLVKRAGINGKVQAVASPCILLGSFGQTRGRAGSRARTLAGDRASYGKIPVFLGLYRALEDKPDFFAWSLYAGYLTS